MILIIIVCSAEHQHLLASTKLSCLLTVARVNNLLSHESGTAGSLTCNLLTLSPLL